MASHGYESASAADVAAPSAEGKFRAAFRRIFGRHFLNAALLAGVCVAFADPVAHPTELIHDPDIWWHLANARTLFARHHFLHADPYSFTLHGQPWVNPEWLAEVPYWLAYRWHGMVGLHLAAIAVLVINLLFIYFRNYRTSRHVSAAFWMALLAFFLIAINAGARTIGFAYLALSLEMLILDMLILDSAAEGCERWLWLLPPLFCIWINLHGSWIIGLFLLALYTACGLFPFHIGVFNQQGFSPQIRNRMFLVFAACVAALFVNPYGWRLVWNPFDMLLNQHLMLATMEEWQPLSLATNTGKAAAVAIGLTIAANCMRSRKWKLYELAFVFFSWYLAFAHQRFVFLACVVTMPWLTADVARSFFGRPSHKTIPAFNILIAAGIVAGFAYLYPSEAMLENDFAAARPLQAIAAIRPSWRTLNDYALGGLMDFDSKAVFIDSRNDLFEHNGIYADYLAIQNLQQPQVLLDKYKIDHVLTPSASALAYVLSRDPKWQVTMREETGVSSFELFSRNGRP
jgi:hypothetical protein